MRGDCCRGLFGIAAPQDRAIELQRLSDLPQAVDDRFVERAGFDASEPDDDFRDQLLDVREASRAGRHGRLDITRIVFGGRE
jgi:hypothetical protein